MASEPNHLPFPESMPGTGPTLAVLAATAVQMATASAYVVGQRGPLIAQAALNPWTADHAELNRIVPEKIAAFTTATGALAVGLTMANRAAVAHVSAMTMAAVTIASRPSARGLADLLDRMGRYNADSAARMVHTASAMLSPIHDSATGNAARLAGAVRGSSRPGPAGRSRISAM